MHLKEVHLIGLNDAVEQPSNASLHNTQSENKVTA